MIDKEGYNIMTEAIWGETDTLNEIIDRSFDSITEKDFKLLQMYFDIFTAKRGKNLKVNASQIESQKVGTSSKPVPRSKPPTSLRRILVEDGDFEKKQKTIPVFSLPLARKLLKSGHKIYDINKNKDGSNRLVFFFYENDKILKELKKK